VNERRKRKDRNDVRDRMGVARRSRSVEMSRQLKEACAPMQGKYGPNMLNKKKLGGRIMSMQHWVMVQMALVTKPFEP